MKKLEKEYNAIKTKEQEEMSELKVSIPLYLISIFNTTLLHLLPAFKNGKQTATT